MNFSTIIVTPSSLGKVLEAMELDLRDSIVANLGSENTPEKILGTESWKKALERYEKERGYADPDIALAELLPFVDFGDLYQLLNAHGLSLPMNLARHVRDSTPQLQKLVPIRNRVAHHRPLLFDDCSITKDVSIYLVVSMETTWKHLRAVLEGLEAEIGSEPKRSVLNNLPVPDYEETGFVGRTKQVDALKKSIVQGLYPVTVIGDGGIGKTALTLKVAYELLNSEDCPFDAIIWTTANLTL